MIVAAQRWKNNAELIADCERLGYVKGRVLDPTYGKGSWWAIHKPLGLVSPRSNFDFRKMPYDDACFDTVAYDPPYVSVGGRKQTSDMAPLYERYGMHETPTSPAGLQELINDGLSECCRVVRPKGHVLVKCSSYISSGRLWPGVFRTYGHAAGLGMELVDQFEFITTPRPQPHNRQVHARRNYSTLLVFRK